MSSPVNLPGDLVVPGNLRVGGTITPTKARSEILSQVELQPFTIPWTAWRIWDAYITGLGATPTSDDDLALIGGTFGTDPPSIQTGDCKAVTKTRYARAVVQVPWDYEAGQSVKIRFHAGMVTTISDSTATIDVVVYRSDEELGLSADLSTTEAATSINSLTFADIDFTITAATITPGDMLDIRVVIAIVDAVATTAVIGCIGAAQLLCDVR